MNRAKGHSWKFQNSIIYYPSVLSTWWGDVNSVQRLESGQLCIRFFFTFHCWFLFTRASVGVSYGITNLLEELVLALWRRWCWGIGGAVSAEYTRWSESENSLTPAQWKSCENQVQEVQSAWASMGEGKQSNINLLTLQTTRRING